MTTAKTHTFVIDGVSASVPWKEWCEALDSHPAYLAKQEVENTYKTHMNGCDYRFVDLSNAQVWEFAIATDFGSSITDDIRTYTVTVEPRWFIVGTARKSAQMVTANGLNVGYKGQATREEAEATLAKMRKQAAKWWAEEEENLAHAPAAEALIGRGTNGLSAPNENTRVGDIVLVRGHTRVRAGLVVRINKGRVKVVYSTNGNRGNAAYAKWVTK